MWYKLLQGREQDYHGLLEQHFPSLLEKIASEKPEALVFVDSSARPFAYLTKKLWQELGLGKVPKIRFVNSLPGWINKALERKVMTKELEANLEQHRLALREFAKKQGWQGKKIVVFDDYVKNGHTIKMLKAEFESQGAVVKTTAFSAPASGFVDFAAINHPREPYWDALLSRDLGKPHVASPKAVERRGLTRLREKMGKVAEKILAERRGK